MVALFLTGRMGAGKDVVADYLVDKYNFTKTAFANGIRDLITRYNPFYIPKSNRLLEIDVGNTMRAWFGDDIWIKSALSKEFMNSINTVVSDGRFPLEYKICVEEAGFRHIHIDASTDIRLQRIYKRDGRVDHNLFYSPDDCQIPLTRNTTVIINNGSLEDLYEVLDGLMIINGVR